MRCTFRAYFTRRCHVPRWPRGGYRRPRNPSMAQLGGSNAITRSRRPDACPSPRDPIGARRLHRDHHQGNSRFPDEREVLVGSQQWNGVAQRISRNEKVQRLDRDASAFERETDVSRVFPERRRLGEDMTRLEKREDGLPFRRGTKTTTKLSENGAALGATSLESRRSSTRGSPQDRDLGRTQSTPTC